MKKSSQKVPAAAEQPSIPKGEEVPLTFSTVRDWGQRLPIGLLAGGQLHRDFGFKQFRMKEERELDAVRKDAKRMSMADFVAAVLSHMLTVLGPYQDFQSLSEQERKMIVHQMWLGDVMYAYIYLRISALGEVIKFKVECPSCGTKSDLPADLYDTDVKIAEGEAALVRSIMLRDGLILEAGGEPVKNLYIQPPRWNAMTSLRAPGTFSLGDVKMAILLSSIRQAGEGRFPLTSQVLDLLTKYDLESLARSIDSMSPGPDMTVETICPACQREGKHPLDWSYDFFFTSSSL